MNPGALLVGLAAALLLVTYSARPFRKTDDADRNIEAWVAGLRRQERKPAGWGDAQPLLAAEPEVPVREPAGTPAPVELTVPVLQQEGAPDAAFCYQCGRPVKPHHRFCPRCGANLDEEQL